jgi:GNAT superfamily N-acetyltransferase
MKPGEGSAATVQVRAMERGDAAAVAELAGQLGYGCGEGDATDWIAGLGARGESQAAFVACVGGVVAGWIEMSLERRLQTPPFVLIGGLVVKDGMRGEGIGRRLCEEAEQWARERGTSRIRVTSRSTRTDAHRFYLRDGYEIVKTSMVFEKKMGG